jgi:ERCC4-type nuclease
MSSLELLIDDRERDVIDCIEEYSTKSPFAWRVRRLIHGDYQIIDKDNNIILIIERKTWQDLAASFKDGRTLNLVEVCKLKKHKIGVVLLIEGLMAPSSGKFFGNIAFCNLLSYLDHVALEFGIHVIQSADTRYTAFRLHSLLKSTNSLTIHNRPYDNGITFYMTQDDEVKSKIENTENTDEKNDEKNKDSKQITYDSKIANTKDTKDVDICALCAIPGISTVVAEILLKANINIKKIINKEVKVEDISELAGPSGKCIGEKNAKKYISGAKLRNVQENILSTIKGITLKTAKFILDETGNLSNMLELGVDYISKLTPTGRTKSIGMAKANEIFLLLSDFAVKKISAEKTTSSRELSLEDLLSED